MNHWKIKKLEDVCEKITDGSHFSPKSTDKGFPYITVRDIQNDSIDFTACKFICSSDYDELVKNGCNPLKGDVLFSKDGTVGKVSLVNYDKNFVVLSSLAIIRPNKNELSSAYLKYLLKAPFFLNEAIGLKTGVAIRRIVLKNLKTIEVPIPSLDEQKQIVAILDEAFAAIEQARANAVRNKANARELFDSTLNNIFATQGEDWNKIELGKVCENFDNKRIPITKKDRENGVYPYYGASGIVDYVGDFIFDEDLLLVSEDGANLLARTYPIAFSVSGKIWVNNHAHVLKFEDKNTQRFIEYFLNSIKLDDYVSGMAQPKLNQKSLNSITLSLPKLSEQEIIVNKLDNLSVQTKRLETLYQQKIDALDELKQSLLKEAFTGQLTKDFDKTLEAVGV